MNYLGNNIEILRNLKPEIYDAVVTDAPYGLGKEPNPNIMLKAWLDHGYLEVLGGGFMNKQWDAFVPQPIFWKEIYRVLKPGGHVICFFGTRTYDWGVMAMRLAGFEIRDQLAWLYGSGMPKNLDISKAIDKSLGCEREVVGQKIRGDVEKAKQSSVSFAAADANKNNKAIFGYGIENLTIPKHELAQKWQGWHTGLKPALEPIVLARKPISESTITDNVLKYGTGGLNIGECKIGDEVRFNCAGDKNGTMILAANKTGYEGSEAIRRYPSNVLFSHDPECTDQCCTADCPIQMLNCNNNNITDSCSLNGSSRFFYCSKPSSDEREVGVKSWDRKISPNSLSAGTEIRGFDKKAVARRANNHPTVKPIDLMRHLVKLVSPKNGKIIDPFAGSGTTGIAAQLEFIDCDLIEQDEYAMKIIEGRLKSWRPQHNLDSFFNQQTW